MQTIARRGWSLPWCEGPSTFSRTVDTLNSESGHSDAEPSINPSWTAWPVGSKKLYRIVARDLVFNIVFAWEGAVAIAQDVDEGRVGSHRFLTCVPDPGGPSVEFFLHYFLTREGLNKLGEASPGGAGRNRTLGLKKLAAIEVPVPSIEKQCWFHRVQAKAQALRKTRTETAGDLDALIPSMLHQVFT